MGAFWSFDVSSATVELAARRWGARAAASPKTLSFMVDGGPILIVAAGDAKVDNHKYKQQFDTKAKMLTADEAAQLVGPRGGRGVPLWVNPGVKVYLDESLKRFETVFPAAGSSNSAIELTIPELERYSGCTAWVDVCKNWQPAEG